MFREHNYIQLPKTHSEVAILKIGRIPPKKEMIHLKQPFIGKLSGANLLLVSGKVW